MGCHDAVGTIVKELWSMKSCSKITHFRSSRTKREKSAKVEGESGGVSCKSRDGPEKYAKVGNFSITIFLFLIKGRDRYLWVGIVIFGSVQGNSLWINYYSLEASQGRLLGSDRSAVLANNSSLMW